MTRAVTTLLGAALFALGAAMVLALIAMCCIIPPEPRDALEFVGIFAIIGGVCGFFEATPINNMVEG